MKLVFKLLVWIAGGILGLGAAGALALYVALAEPHIDRREWRVAGPPETIEVLYVFYMCGEDYPMLYEIVPAADGELVWSDRPTTLALPQGVPSPEDTELAVSGNVFRLTGYRYQAEERNILTGRTRARSSTRFDVVSWRVETPYHAWHPSENGGGAEQQTRVAPVRYAMTGGDDPGRFTPRRYAYCP